MDNLIPINSFIFYKNMPQTLNPVLLEFEDILPQYLIYPTSEIFSILKNKFLKYDINHAGYCRICLMTRNGKRNFSIHRLVATMFIINPYPDLYTDVNHIDGNKLKNSYLNLEWCSNNQNKHHAAINGLYERGEERYNNVYPDSLAIEICEKFQLGIPYEDVYHYYINLYNSDDSKLGSFIYKLYHRKTRNYITKNFVY